MTATPEAGRRRTERRCRTVALVGVDGAGKTSVAQAILASPPIPLKYLYMGTSIESSNVALPTSRMAHWWKVRQHRRELSAQGRPVPDRIDLHGLEHRVRRRGKVGSTLRLLRRVTEESYRQLVSWIHQLRGFVVLYDRHFVFDALKPASEAPPTELSERLHYWFLRYLYPKPDLALFLDAPTNVLLARKQEIPPDRLEHDRSRIQQRRAHAHHFVRVDAALPQDEVIRQVADLIREHCSGRSA
ncbi:MAG: hypothetical protein OEO23_12290 [Gemmatimonadota bacterium]|nr:hypothetical protein [Gemmatimonadota bacterium]